MSVRYGPELPLFELPANITLMDYDDTHGRFLAIRASGRRRVVVDTGWSGVGSIR